MDKLKRSFQYSAKGLEDAIKYAFDNKIAIYFYQDEILVDEVHEENCYLRYTQILESEHYDEFNKFEETAVMLFLDKIKERLGEEA